MTFKNFMNFAKLSKLELHGHLDCPSGFSDRRGWFLNLE